MNTTQGFWIKEPIDIRNKKTGPYNVNFIYKQGNVFIMDNHLAAAYCWIQELDKNENLNFFHIDQHEDLCSDAPVKSYIKIKDTSHISLNEFLSMHYQSGEKQAFSFENYILQTQRIFPNWFRKCCFACHYYVVCEELDMIPQLNNINLLGSISNASKWGYATLERDKDNRWIINIDLDYFFYSNAFQMLTNEYIQFLFEDLKNAMEESKKIAIVTIALSPECCGGWDKVIPIANYIAKELGLDFKL